MEIKVDLPIDEDGYVLLKCPKCSTNFMLHGNEMKSEDVIDIYCPACGIISNNYLTEKVIIQAITLAKNYCINELKKSFSKLGKFECKEEKVKDVDEYASCNDLVDMRCCNKRVKISSFLKESYYYCPYCGVSYDK